MGYQALLFCPDEKTARTVTQVLSELDFSVIPCTEPFAAVKKLMGEHFDALVVDCDNEQNATLLFKSARNAPNNHSSLAVAVVEGQAGVAKAFRIGANLVLTKPVNVEQAKGTLRVARGFLRKSEAAKPATGAVSATVKPAAPAPLKPALQRTIPSVSTAGQAPLTPAVTAAAASIPTQKPVPQPRVVASVPTEITTGEAPFEARSEEIGSPSINASASQPGILSLTAGHSPSAGRFGTSAASAPAPAREPKPSVATEPKPENAVETVAASVSSASVEEISAAGPAFTFGGQVSSGTEPSGGGSKKALLALAAVVLIAAGGYEVWMQWERSGGAATGSVPFAVQSVTTAAKVPRVPPSAAPVAPSSDASPAPSPTPVAVAASPVAANKVTATEAPATKAAAPPIKIKNQSAQPEVGKSPPSGDVIAPSIAGIAPAGDSAALPSLMGSQSKTSTPLLQDLHVSQGVSRGLLVKAIQPAYPASARQMRIEGAVELSATVSKNGDISTVKVLSGDPQLARAAVEAVKQWKYKPYLLNGEPVEIQTQVTVKFKLPR
jgi:protein TonB